MPFAVSGMMLETCQPATALPHGTLIKCRTCLQVRHIYETVQPEQSRDMDLLLLQAWLAAGDPDRCLRRQLWMPLARHASTMLRPSPAECPATHNRTIMPPQMEAIKSNK